MARPKKSQPDYRYHMSGQAVVTFDQKNFYLGPHDSPESKAKYYRLLAIYAETGRAPTEDIHQQDAPITVAHITAEAREWIAVKYAKDRTQTIRLNNLCGTLDDEYGDTPASEFGPRKLAELRDLFIAGGNCRKYANTQTANVVRIFRYAVSRELIDGAVLVNLDSLEPLRYGQTKARESSPVKPANIEHVRATAKFLSPPLRAMVRIQAATGMRPGEVCAMRPMDVDRSGEVWVYRPEDHKTAWRGKTKAVPIIGDAREALQPFLNRPADAYCFSPAESMRWHWEQRRAKRVTPANQGNRAGTNKKSRPEIVPGLAYSKDSYRRAIQRAAEQAKVDHWFPYMLRHMAGTMVRDALGVEAAQALLGHSRAAMTEHYAKQNESKAIAAAMAAPCVGGE